MKSLLKSKKTLELLQRHHGYFVVVVDLMRPSDVVQLYERLGVAPAIKRITSVVMAIAALMIKPLRAGRIAPADQDVVHLAVTVADALIL